MQNATTVTGTGTGENDTIDCSSADRGKTINGKGGNDTITGGIGRSRTANVALASLAIARRRLSRDEVA